MPIAPTFVATVGWLRVPVGFLVSSKGQEAPERALRGRLNDTSYAEGPQSGVQTLLHNPGFSESILFGLKLARVFNPGGSACSFPLSSVHRNDEAAAAGAGVQNSRMQTHT